MAKTIKYLTTLLFPIAAISIALGAAFIYQALDKEHWIKQAMRQEQVTLGIPDEAVKRGDVIDTADEAQKAADLVREHRRNLAPTYQALLAGGRYDPGNPKHLTYTQALNMENYLYMAVLALGVTTAFLGIGTFMILSGAGIGIVGALLFVQQRGNRE
jgi:uncharacterized membrane protein SpoIIM required for sporulation